VTVKRSFSISSVKAYGAIAFSGPLRDLVLTS
jgi:hypothetical protein